jgi:hypothetical protein
MGVRNNGGNKMKKNNFIKKKIKGITVDVRAKDCLYVKIKDWVIYIDNSTNEKIINTWKEVA